VITGVIVPIRSIKLFAILALLPAATTLQAADREHNPVARQTHRVEAEGSRIDVIVKLRASGPGGERLKLANGPARMAELSKRTGLHLGLRREISESMLATRVDLAGSRAAAALTRLRADPAVEYVAIDRMRYPHATQPNDALFPGQWYLGNAEVSAVNAVDAWDRERGSNGVVVAVLDTGVLYDHPDLGRADRGGRLLAGFDFVSATHMVNDGGSRDADPSDPGDWVNASDKEDAVYENCDITSSSWHGTRVAGVVGALTNNAGGVAGLSWNSFILPVRVLGKCGGRDSDILAGLRWAAGLSVPGVPANPTPARILNASFGDDGPCEPSYRDVIAELRQRKALLVISAGNEGTVVSSPANCEGVAAVAAIRHAGSKVGFSSLGPEVTLAAPGGNCVNIGGGPCLFSLDTTSNAGTERPAAHIFTDQINSNLGTSFSAPIVSGIAALMVSRNANLSTAQLLERLREGARPFPTSIPGEPGLPTCHVPANDQDFQLAQCLCTVLTCGAGMADASRSVDAADRPIAAIALPAQVAPGQTVTLDATGSVAACGRSVSAFAWTVVEPVSDPPTLIDADRAAASLIAPASGAITLRVTVTDDQGRTDSAEVTVESNRAFTTAPASAGAVASSCPSPVSPGPTPGGTSPSPTPNPPQAGGGRSGGGGGGAMGAIWLLALALLLGQRGRARMRRCN
jgi:serine protease